MKNPRFYRLTTGNVALLVAMAFFLHACMDEAYEIFQMIATRYSGEALRRAGELHAALHFGRMDVIFDYGLHEYLTEFLGRLTELGGEVDRSFFNVAYA